MCSMMFKQRIHFKNNIFWNAQHDLREKGLSCRQVHLCASLSYSSQSMCYKFDSRLLHVIFLLGPRLSGYITLFNKTLHQKKLIYHARETGYVLRKFQQCRLIHQSHSSWAHLINMWDNVRQCKTWLFI